MAETRERRLTSPRDPFWIVLAIVFPLLAFPNLGNIYLWQDEAETALLARCVLLHGYPLAQDGTNVITDQEGRGDLRNGVWIWTPWLQLYVAAASFGLLGESTWAARLPFTLIGFAAVLVPYPAFRELTSDRRLARFATLLLATSVPYLLHVRQCRYYTLVVLFSVLQIWGYARILRERRGGATMIAASGIGLAQTFFPQLVAGTAALGLHALFVSRDRRVLRAFLTASGVAAAVSLPFFVYTRSWSRDYGGSGHGYESLSRFIAALRAYVIMTHAYGWPFLLAIPLLWRRQRARAIVILLAATATLGLALPPGKLSFTLTGLAAAGAAVAGIAWLARKRAPEEWAGDWKPATLLVLAVSVPAAAALCPFPFFRYLLGSLPFLLLWTAYSVGELVRWRTVGLVLAGAVLIATNLVSQAPFAALSALQRTVGTIDDRRVAEAMAFGHRPSNVPAVTAARLVGTEQRWSLVPMLDYLGEITSDYDGPIEAGVRYLQANARPGQSLLVTYEHFPFMFYTRLSVARRYALSAPLPDWIFVHGSGTPTPPVAIQPVLRTHYDPVVLGVKDVSWENIPEPYWHWYATRRQGREVELYRRRNAGP